MTAEPSRAADRPAPPLRVDSAYDWLVDAITNLRLPAGSPLLENSLARQLGVSRTPVREALQRLEREGLVQRSPSNRFAVAVPSVREIEEACDAMRVLDSYLFQQAARRLTAEQASDLEATVDAMRQAAEAGDLGTWSDADQQFHATLAAASGNHLVSDLVRQVRRRVQRYWLSQAVRNERLVGCSAEHAELARAVRTGDIDAVPPLVATHIDHMRQSLLGMLRDAAPLLGSAAWPVQPATDVGSGS